MRSIATLRACSRCLQGHRGRHPGLLSSVERVIDNRPIRFAQTRHRFTGRYGTQDRRKLDLDAPLLDRIAQLPKDLIISKRKILMLLSTRNADVQSLLAFVPFIETYAHRSSIQDASEVISLFVAKLGDLNALALLSEVLRLFKSTIERDLDPLERSTTPAALNTAYLHIFRALGSFYRRNVSDEILSQARVLHPIIHNYIQTLFASLDNQLRSLPSTSNSSPSQSTSPAVSKEILELLLTRPYLTFDLSGTLMKYCKRHHLKRSSWVWWRCCTVAADKRHFETAEAYSALAKREAKKEAKSRESKIDGDNDTIGLHAVGLASEGYGDSRWSAKTGQEVGRIMRLGSKQKLRSVMDILEPHLSDTSDPTSTDAWSRLLSSARQDDTVDAGLLLSLRQSITASAIDCHTLTPIMMGLLERGEVGAAWDTWQELVDLHRNSTSEPGKFLDSVALAVGSLVCHAKYGFETTISLVDAWAYKPRSPQPTQQSSDKVTLDTFNVNILLQMCRKDNQPGVAFRLFAAAMPRWGVYTDSISLTLLLDTARSWFQGDGGDVPDIKNRLRQLVDEMGFRRSSAQPTTQQTGAFDAYDDSGFARGSASVLLDQAGYLWQDDNAAPPWSRAKDLFETVILSNYPWLADDPSPLDFHNGPYAHQVRDLSSFFRTRAAQKALLTDSSSPIRLPDPANARYTHLVPSANTFHSYITLLGRHGLTTEMPVALAWMRSLDIRPLSQTMVTALMYIQDVEGPRRLFRDWDNGNSRLVGDGDVLRRWLGDWLGSGVPTEEDVASRIRQSMAKYQSSPTPR